MPVGGGRNGANNLDITEPQQHNNNEPISDDDDDVIAPVHGVDNGHRKG